MFYFGWTIKDLDQISRTILDPGLGILCLGIYIFGLYTVDEYLRNLYQGLGILWLDLEILNVGLSIFCV